MNKYEKIVVVITLTYNAGNTKTVEREIDIDTARRIKEILIEDLKGDISPGLKTFLE